MNITKKLLKLFEKKSVVLIADDDEDLAEMTKEILQDELDCEIILCTKIQNLDDHIGKVDVVLLDSFYGKADPFIKKFQSRGAKVFAYTGGDINKDLENVYDGIFPKPCEVDKMAKEIKKYI